MSTIQPEPFLIQRKRRPALRNPGEGGSDSAFANLTPEQHDLLRDWLALPSVGQAEEGKPFLP